MFSSNPQLSVVNYHAHVLYDCQDLQTGKAVRLGRDYFRKRQDVLAECTGMERGNPASETGRRHRSAMQQRIVAQEERLAELERLVKEREEAHQAEPKKLAEEKEKAVKKAKEEAQREATSIISQAQTKYGTIVNAAAEDAQIKADSIVFFAKEEAAKQLKSFTTMLNNLNEQREALEIDITALEMMRDEGNEEAAKQLAERQQQLTGINEKISYRENQLGKVEQELIDLAKRRVKIQSLTDLYRNFV